MQKENKNSEVELKRIPKGVGGLSTDREEPMDENLWIYARPLLGSCVGTLLGKIWLFGEKKKMKKRADKG